MRGLSRRGRVSPFAAASGFMISTSVTFSGESRTAEREKEYREKLEEALRAGHAVLARGGPSLDAVEASIRILEDSPLFNAGKGAVFTHEGKNELDAAIMDGRTKMAGS